jgi:ATP-dependent Zn protease
MKLENKNKYEFDKTGNFVPIEYNELVSLVFEAMNIYVNSIINNYEKELNPLEKHVIIVKKNGQVLQVPDDIQQDAITMYFEKNPNLKTFFNIDNYNDNNNDNDNDNDNYTDNSSNKLYFVFIIFILLIYFFGKYMKYL